MGYDRGDSFPFDFLNQMEFHLVQNRKENCHHDHIPLNVKGNGILVFSVWTLFITKRGLPGILLLKFHQFLESSMYIFAAFPLVF